MPEAWIRSLEAAWPLIVPFLALILIVWASLHVLLNKEDTRSASGWLALIFFSPMFGSILYYLLGINRLRRRATWLKGTAHFTDPDKGLQFREVDSGNGSEAFAENIAAMERLGRIIIGKPLERGNAVDLLENGESAFPAMLEAIDAARNSVGLCTYIFDNDFQGRAFAAALARARRRGLAVRVLIDGLGVRYSLPSITRTLKRDDVPHALFLRTLLPWRLAYANLRNHRKLLVTDGSTAFLGGMNLRRAWVSEEQQQALLRDLHFRVRGPVVADLMGVFARDWQFAAGEILEGSPWFPALESCGEVPARALPDGPDEDFEKILWVLLGALANAQKSVRIQCPYFLPDARLVSALSVAALSGVDVRILVPERNNLRLVQWAQTPTLLTLLRRGCRIFANPPPFDHAKLMVVDDAWVLIGSSNWDARSLQLNFELNLETYHPGFSRRMADCLDRKFAAARPIPVSELESLSRFRQLRNQALRLFSPYL